MDNASSLAECGSQAYIVKIILFTSTGTVGDLFADICIFENIWLAPANNNIIYSMTSSVYEYTYTNY